MNNDTHTPALTIEDLTFHAVNGLVPAARAAEFLRYFDSNTIRKDCRENKVPGAAKMGRDWAVPLEWVMEKNKEDRTKPGRPRGSGNKTKQLNLLD